eukprot:3921941-Pyramimonas_sp.AAC.1
MAASMVAVGADLGPPSKRKMREYNSALFATSMPKGRQWACQWILLSVILKGHMLDPVTASHREVMLSVRRQ